MDKVIHELLSSGSLALCLLTKAGKVHPAMGLSSGLEKLCEHIDMLEARITKLEKEKVIRAS